MVTANQIITNIKRRVVDALFPDGITCLCCDRELRSGETELCAACREGLRHSSFIPAPEPLDGVYAAYLYNDIFKQAIARYKYGRATNLAAFLARDIPIPEDWQIDAYVPVPLHFLKEFQRRFNQSELLAEALSARKAAPVQAKLLKRTRYTVSQTTLNTKHRNGNVRGAFKVCQSCNGLSIVLVDDVFTTGSTLCECARVLKKAGAKHVYALTSADAFMRIS